MSEPFTPRPEHHVTVGRWTVGNPGRDPVASVHRLAELGAR